MKTITEVENAFQSDNLQSTDIGFEVNPVSVNHMLNSLYADIVGTILREITTNAIESHMVAGTDRKVAIQLPTNIDQNLYFRDYGTGLNEEETIKYLGTLFSTNKNQDNSLPGGFGLGAKSPLALVDSFLISVVKDNIKNTYMWVKEKGRLPRFVNISQNERTSEDSGVFYQIPLENNPKINTDNIRTLFETKANQQLIGFQDQVMFVSNILESDYNKLTDVSDSVWEYELAFECDGLFILKHKQDVGYSGTLRTFNVSIGGVIYPYERLRYEAESLFESHISSDLRYYYFLKMPIGSLDIPMSREEVMDHSENTEIIQKQLQKVPQIFEQYSKDVLDMDLDCDYPSFYTQQNKTSTNVCGNYKGSVLLKMHYPLQTLLKKEPEIAKLFATATVDGYYPTSGYYNTSKTEESCRPARILNNPAFFSNNFKFVEADDTRANVNFSQVPRADRDPCKVFLIPSPAPVTYANLSFYVKEMYGYDNTDTFYFLSVKDDYRLALLRVVEAYNAQAELVQGSGIEIIGEYSENAYKDFKAQLKTSPTVSFRSSVDFIPGAFKANLTECSYSLYGGEVLLDRYQHFLEKKRINHLLNAQGRKVSLGADYLSEEEKKGKVIVISSEASSSRTKLPLFLNTDYFNLKSYFMKEQLDNITVISVTPRSFEGLVSRLKKDGIDVYTEDNPLSLKALTLDDLTEEELVHYVGNQDFTFIKETVSLEGGRRLGSTGQELLCECITLFTHDNARFLKALNNCNINKQYSSNYTYTLDDTSVLDFIKSFETFCKEYVKNLSNSKKGLETIFVLLRNGNMDKEDFLDLFPNTP